MESRAPAGTPRDVVAKINADIQKVFADPDFREKFLDRAMLDPIAGSPDQFAEFIKAEAAKWSKVVKDANLKSRVSHACERLSARPSLGAVR